MQAMQGKEKELTEGWAGRVKNCTIEAVGVKPTKLQFE